MILPHTPLFSRIGSYLTVLLALLLGAGLGLPSAGHAQNTYTVTNTDDNGAGSLRAAINNANDGSGTPADVIEFDIPESASSSNPHVIQPESELPDISDPLTIDGSTEPDHDGNNPPPVIEIDGTNAGSASGLYVIIGGSLTVRELAIVKFEDIGLRFGGDAGNGNLVQGCYVGVRADGTTPAGNGRGIAMFTRADDTRIGAGFGQRNQRTLDDLNVIAANDFLGISVIAAATIQGNYVGVDRGGDPAGNGSAGPYDGAGLSLNTSGATVGGPRFLEFNLIAHNDGDGVEVDDVTPPDVGNSIRANFIFANGGLGIDLEGGIEDPKGQTENDDGDADDGQNRFQNFPVIQSASYDAGADEVTVTYTVPSDPDATGDGASAYDLFVDFYEADDDGEEGSNYLYTDTYTTSDYNTMTSGPDAKTITFTPDGDVTSSDKILATATDDNGNTSEFSAQPQQLPVELASFEAAQTGNEAVELTWTTASETNNTGFRVQHRVSKNEGWTKVGSVESKASGGTTTEAQTYRFSAEDLSVGTHQFRLEQVDLDGTATVHDPVTVELQMREALRLRAPAPNPVAGQATLSFAVKKEQKTVLRLYNALGQEVATVYEGTPTAGESQTVQFETTDLASGTYFLRLRANGRSQTERLTVVR